ncbi:U-box domain-containing protein [Chytridium lagenaria]|nr:U-box domain-containing protein [Chytridium lagenaria]
MTELNSADTHKLLGNEFFAAGRFTDAIDEYSKAIIKNQGSNAIYFSNRANCYFKLERYQQCVSDCERATQLDFKISVNLAQYNEALSCLRKEKTKAKKWEMEDEKRRETNSDIYRYLRTLIERDRQKQKAQLSFDDRESRDEVDQSFDDRLSQLSVLVAIAEEDAKKREVPDAFIGKISFELMTDPVIGPSGITYDRSEILTHLRKIGKWDPIARTPMTEKDLIPNLALKEVIDAFLEKNGWAADY